MSGLESVFARDTKVLGSILTYGVVDPRFLGVSYHHMKVIRSFQVCSGGLVKISSGFKLLNKPVSVVMTSKQC